MPMKTINNCTECGNVGRCLKLIQEGKAPYCGGSLCKPIPKEETKHEKC